MLEIECLKIARELHPEETDLQKLFKIADEIRSWIINRED